MIFPIRLKLALVTSALLIVGISTVSALVLDRSREALAEEAQKRGVSLARNLARSAREPVLLQEDLIVANLLASVAQESIVAARIVDTDGRLIGSSRNSDPRQHPRLTLQGQRATETQAGLLLVAERMTFQNVDLGEVQIVIDLEGLIAPVVNRAQRDVVLASSGLLLIGLIIAFAGSARVTRPLQRLRSAVNALAAGDLDVRVETTSRDEVADLTRAFNEMGASLTQKRHVETAFRRYVSDHVLQEVLDHPEAIALHGEERDVTVVFVDIRKFSSLADQLGAERMVEFLNETFELLTVQLLRQGATVDKYIGDAILAYFGAPIESVDHPQRAIAAAKAMQRSVRERNEKCEALGAPYVRLEVGIGVATGPVIVGNIGSDLKMDYTAIGDAVNVANRLQKLAGANRIFTTEAVARFVRGMVELESLGTLELEGYAEPVDCYSIPY